MSTLITDTFIRADAPNLGANWTKAPYSTSQLTIASNKAACPATGGTTDSYWSAASAMGNDQWAEVVVQANPAANDGGPIVRSNPAAQTFYAIRINFSDTVALGSSQTFELYDVAATVFTLVGSTATQVIAAGDVLRIEIEGTTLRGYLNDVLKASGSPSSRSSGNFGIDWWNPNAPVTTLGQFQAGDFGRRFLLGRH